MKKITLIFFSLFFCLSMSAQIGIIEALNSTTLPAGWVNSPNAFGVDFFSTTTNQCEGSHGWEVNVYSGNTDGILTTNNLVGASNGTDITVNFQWRARDFFGAAVGLSTLVEYSVNNGTTWLPVGDPITASEITPCTVFNAVIPSAAVPAGSDFKLRFNVTWVTGDCYFLVDNVNISQVPSNPPACTTVSNPANGAVDVSSTVVSWTGANGLPSGYKLSVGTTATGTELLNMQDVGLVTSYDLGFLEAATVYYVTVVPYNANGDAVGCTTTSFTTCGPVTELPWTEGFEGLATVGNTVFPGCWIKENGAWETFNGNSPYNTPRTGTKYLRNNWGAVNEYIWTKGFTLTAGTSYDFSTYVQGDNGTTWTVDMYVHDAPNSSGASAIGDPYAVPGTGGGNYFPTAYNEMRRSFTPSTTGIYYFGVRVNEPTSGPWYVAFDDFRVEVTPTCQAPIDLDVANITTTSADFTWANVGSETAWDVVIGDSDDTDPNTLTIIDEINTFHPFTTLQPNTAYKVWVRADCTAGSYSAWSGPFTFKTLCNEVTEFYQSFDAATTLPDCWAKVGTTGTVNVVANTAAASSPNVLVLNSSSVTSRGVVSLAPVSNAAAGTHRLKFKARASFSWNVGAEIEVGYLAVANDADSFVMVQTFTTTSATVYDTFIAELGTAPETGFLALRHSGDPSFTETFIDDVIWEALPTTAPGCAVVTGTPNASCGNYPNTISWTPTAGADSYYLSLGTTPGGVDLLNSEDIGNVLSYTFEGTAATTYYYTVTPFNAVGSATGCVEQSFTTAPVPCVCIPEYTTGKTDGDLISNIVITGTTLSNNTGTTPVNPAFTYFTGQPNYTATLQAGSSYNVQVSVGTFGNQNVAVWIDYNDNAEFETSERVGFTTTPISSSGTATFTISLACNPPLGLHRMRVRDVYFTPGNEILPCAVYGFGETEDYDVTISAPVACPQPSGLAATTTFESAELTWNIGCAETAWDVHVGIAGSGAPTGAPSDPNVASGFVVGNLLASTAYEFYVRANCDTDGFSVWSGPFAFTTNAVPPSNDSLCNATTLVVDATSSGTAYTVVAATSQTAEPVPSCFNGGINGSVWFSFVAPTSGEVRVTTDIAGGSMSDTEIAVYSSTGVVCSDLSTLAPALDCDNDSGENVINTSTIDFEGASALTPGAMYYVQVDRWGTATAGTFGIRVIDMETLSSDDFSTQSFTAYPNPVKNVLNLSHSQNITDVAVFNLLGQQVVVKSINATVGQIDMANLASGTYLVKVTANDMVKTIKIVKE